MADVFISHSTKDANIANYIVNSLEQRGLKCWIAPRDIPAGADWATAITSGLSSSKSVIIIYSANSAASTQVPKEITIAQNKGLNIIPYRIDNTPLTGAYEYHLSMSQWITPNIGSGNYGIDELYNAVISKKEDTAPPNGQDRQNGFNGNQGGASPRIITPTEYQQAPGQAPGYNYANPAGAVEGDTIFVSKTVSLLLCIFLGYFGAHKFYERNIFMGIIYFLTFGLFLIGWGIDIVRLIMKPAERRLSRICSTAINGCVSLRSRSRKQ